MRLPRSHTLSAAGTLDELLLGSGFKIGT